MGADTNKKLEIILETERFCPYHKEHFSRFPLEKLGPKGLCLEMYYALYPLCFAYVYGAKFETSQIIARCPKNLFCSFLVRKKNPNPWMYTKNVAKDFVDKWKVFAKECFNVEIVANQVFRKCSAQEKYRFNLNSAENIICPAAFSSIYPHVQLEIEKGRASLSRKVIACPDHKVDLRFQIGEKTQETDCETCGCYDFSKVWVSVEGEREDQSFESDILDIVKAYGFKCFTAFQVLFPYYLTLTKNGELGFYTDDRQSAIVQCPSGKHKIEFMIFKDRNSETIYHKVIGARGECPLGYSLGDACEINNYKNFSPYDLYVAYLYACRLQNDQSLKQISFGSPFGVEGKIITVTDQKREGRCVHGCGGGK